METKEIIQHDLPVFDYFIGKKAAAALVPGDVLFTKERRSEEFYYDGQNPIKQKIYYKTMVVPENGIISSGGFVVIADAGFGMISAFDKYNQIERKKSLFGLREQKSYLREHTLYINNYSQKCFYDSEITTFKEDELVWFIKDLKGLKEMLFRSKQKIDHHDKFFYFINT